MRRAAAMLLIALALLSGCAKVPDAVDIPAPAQTAAQTAAQTPAPSPSPDPSPSPSPTPAHDPTRVEISEGFWYNDLDAALKARITGMSYPAEGEECRISYDDLRYIHILYVDFEGAEHEGELIVNARLARETAEIFLGLYEAGYPLASVRLVDDFGEPGDDNISMAANNTSAFNYRRVTGSSKLSRHSYGAAVDINPLYNPYIDGDRIAPPEAAPYADRSWDFAGKIEHGDLAYELFTAAGWEWGGDWRGDKDYQHFSKDLDY